MIKTNSQIQFLHNLRVLRSENLSANNFILELETPPTEIVTVFPGQFATFALVHNGQPQSFAFRRPFSIYDVSHHTIKFLYNVKGVMTKQFSLLKPNQLLNVHFPIGNSFLDFIKTEDRNIVLVAGGLGISAMHLLAKHLLAEHKNVSLIYGARTNAALLEVNAFRNLGLTVILTTEDGSAGLQGNVMQGLQQLNKDIDLICCCGPEKMMAAVAHFAKSHVIPCYTSLEKLMACGTGSCMGCVVKTSSHGFIPTCLEGPVINAWDIVW